MRHVALTTVEIAALRSLEANPRSLRRGTILRQQPVRTGEMYIVEKGWLQSFVLLDDGSRQILQIHLPGDLIGGSVLAFGMATESLAAVTDVAVYAFDRALLRPIFHDHPRLAMLFQLIGQAERVALTDRIASIGRTSARARVAALLMDLVDRLRAMQPDLGARFVLPLTQEEIGDATGLTAVHVNRMMRGLVEDGLIARQHSHITLLDEPRLMRIAHHPGRAAMIEGGWIPAAE